MQEQRNYLCIFGLRDKGQKEKWNYGRSGEIFEKCKLCGSDSFRERRKVSEGEQIPLSLMKGP